MRNLIDIAVVASIGICLCCPSDSQAQEASLFAPSSTVISYDPFSGLPGLAEVTLEITYSGEDARLARLLISPDIAPDFHLAGNGENLLFEIDTAHGQSSPNQLEAEISLEPSSAPQRIKLAFKIPAGQYADAGDLDIDLKIELFDLLSLASISNNDITRLTSRVPLRAQTNFAGTSSGFENGSSYALINFGEIVAGDSRSINFQIRGNSDVDITMNSENNGRLVNLESPDISYLSYSVNADGVSSDLSSPLDFSRRPEKSLTGSLYPLTITLDNLPQTLFAGQYKDILSIDVTPR